MGKRFSKRRKPTSQMRSLQAGSRSRERSGNQTAESDAEHQVPAYLMLTDTRLFDLIDIAYSGLLEEQRSRKVLSQQQFELMRNNPNDTGGVSQLLEEVKKMSRGQQENFSQRWM